jgi:hypothetical protein
VTDELSLRVYVEDDSLVLEATNAGNAEVRLWQQSNSWGWPMPRVYVDAGGAEPHCLSPAPRVWTRNFPSSVELAPGESARYVLRAGDLDPATLEPVHHLWQEPLWVRGELRCTPSPEAGEYGVWCGTVRGPRAELPPPHEWLRPA